jgi:hypothetical protein
MTSKPNNIDPSKIVGHQFPDKPVEYNRRDVIMYALGVGAEELPFVYENHPRFSVLPTYPAALVMKGNNADVIPFAPSAGIPGLKFNPSMLLQ